MSDTDKYAYERHKAFLEVQRLVRLGMLYEKDRGAFLVATEKHQDCPKFSFTVSLNRQAGDFYRFSCKCGETIEISGMEAAIRSS